MTKPNKAEKLPTVDPVLTGLDENGIRAIMRRRDKYFARCDLVRQRVERQTNSRAGSLFNQEPQI